MEIDVRLGRPRNGGFMRCCRRRQMVWEEIIRWNSCWTHFWNFRIEIQFNSWTWCWLRYWNIFLNFKLHGLSETYSFGTKKIVNAQPYLLNAILKVVIIINKSLQDNHLIFARKFPISMKRNYQARLNLSRFLLTQLSLFMMKMISEVYFFIKNIFST